MTDYPIVQSEIRLNCLFGSACMAATIRLTVKKFESAVVFIIGEEAADARDLFNLCMADTAPRERTPPWRRIRVQACGPDAKAAVAAVVNLFPSDGGPEKCVLPWCGRPACLLHPLPTGGFAYRCAIFEIPKQHCWFMAPRSLPLAPIRRKPVNP